MTRKLQQGDVIIKSVSMIPMMVRRVGRSERGYILKEGEVTGHAHRIEYGDMEMYEDKDGTLYLRVKEPVEVKHEEHKPIQLEIGTYVVYQVREFDPWEAETRWVRD